MDSLIKPVQNSPRESWQPQASATLAVTDVFGKPPHLGQSGSGLLTLVCVVSCCSLANSAVSISDSQFLATHSSRVTVHSVFLKDMPVAKMCVFQHN